MQAVNYEKIGERIKLYRSKKGLSQEQLSIMVLANPKHLSRIESTGRPSLELLIQLANALDVSADDILMDSLDHVASKGEIPSLLFECTDAEKTFLTKMLRYMKTLLSDLGI